MPGVRVSGRGAEVVRTCGGLPGYIQTNRAATTASHAATVRVRPHRRARPRLGGLWLVLGISGPLHSIDMSGVTVLTMTSFVKHELSWHNSLTSHRRVTMKKQGLVIHILLQPNPHDSVAKL